MGRSVAACSPPAGSGERERNVAIGKRGLRESMPVGGRSTQFSNGASAYTPTERGMASNLHRGITVEELLATEHLELRLMAGAGGVQRRITWTHVSELPKPELWLDGGELLMTNGLGLPSDSRGQQDFIARLAARRISGLAIGVLGPLLHREATVLADELDFPLLHVPKPVPFVSIARLVADCNHDHAQRRMATHIQLFDTLRTGCEPANASALLDKLADISGYSLYLTSPSGRPLLPGLDEAPHEIAEMLERSPGDIERVSYSVAGGHIVPIPLGERTAGFLIAVERQDAGPAGFVALRHVGTIAALLISNLYRDREQVRRVRAELLGRIFGAGDSTEVVHLLKGTGLEAGPLSMARVRGDARAIEELYHRLADIGLPQLTLTDEAGMYLVMEDAPETLRALTNGLDLLVGVSAAFSPTDYWTLSRLEAGKALDRAITDAPAGRTLVQYSPGDSPLEWLPTDPATVRALSERILGPLAEYDRQSGASLLESLRMYLNCDRRLSVAAEALYVHKHTLAYRLKRIEALTHRRLTSMDDLCVIWLALKVQESLETSHVTHPPIGRRSRVVGQEASSSTPTHSTDEAAEAALDT